MDKFEEMSKSLKDLYQKLAVTGKRAAAITRMRVELAGLDRQRRDTYSQLGEKLNELRRSGQISDAGLLVVLEGEFEKIDRVTMKIQNTSDEIKKLNLDDPDTGIPEQAEEIDVESGETENLLDSFGVV